jgi:hypothetical protein
LPLSNCSCPWKLQRIRVINAIANCLRWRYELTYPDLICLETPMNFMPILLLSSNPQVFLFLLSISYCDSCVVHAPIVIQVANVSTACIVRQVAKILLAVYFSLPCTPLKISSCSKGKSFIPEHNPLSIHSCDLDALIFNSITLSIQFLQKLSSSLC